MLLTSTPIPTLTLDEFAQLTSSVTTDTVTWGTTTEQTYPGFGAIPTVGTGGTGTTYNPFNPAGGHTYTTNTTSPWIATGTGINPAMVIGQSGSIDIQGENADIKMNGKSMKAWMEQVEERLNILTPNPELEADWDELQELGERYRALERKCKEKAKMWATLKKVQPKQP